MTTTTTAASTGELEWPVARVRQTFVDFFAEQQHTRLRSAPVIPPPDDKSLLFINAGMAPLKAAFLGTANPNSELGKLKRAANSQKCIRAGGKHNDLEDVGKDTYHHTFFEMLGNWSFGDYFKREAIDWAWHLLTEVYKLPKERLYVTYFGGDAREPTLAADDEARQLWLRYVPTERVLPFGMKENFWEMGEQGPCGPCSEIHFDRLDNRPDAAKLVNADDPTLIEIWNLVFIQFNREADRSLRQLPNKHVDTGMGLERITSILQKVMSNYDTDVFMPIFGAIQKASGARPYSFKVGAADTDHVDMAYRVIADHIRTLCIALADKGQPGSDGRSFVLRRILRRAVRYGREVLKAPAGFFAGLVDIVCDQLGGAYPELIESREHIKGVLSYEETLFGRSFDRGLAQFKRLAARAATTESKQIAGDHLYELCTSRGFPYDLVQLMAEEHDPPLSLDKPGFERKMEEHRRKSEASARHGTELKLDANALSHLAQSKKFALTDDAAKYAEPVAPIEATLLACWDGAEWVDSALPDITTGLVLDRTNFYAEQGGQSFDTGRILLAPATATAPAAGTTTATTDDAEDVEFEVSSVQVFGGYVLHIGRIVVGELRLGAKLRLVVDASRRLPIMVNHTCTHVANLALRKTLGPRVEQRGSLVQPEKFRFDFSHDAPLSADELESVDRIVNEAIARDLPVSSKLVPKAQAEAIRGVRAMFGEQYPDPVNVVIVGATVDEVLADASNERWMDLSVEFCGGTHLRQLGIAQAFTVVEQESVAKGVQRISVVTGETARTAVAAGQALTERVAALVRGSTATAPAATTTTTATAATGSVAEQLVALQAELATAVIPESVRRRLRQQLETFYEEKIKKDGKGLRVEQERQGAVFAEKLLADVAAQTAAPAFVVARLDVGSNSDALTKAIKVFHEKQPGIAVMLLSVEAGKKVFAVAVVPAAVVARGLKANEWIQNVSAVLGGKGGGKDITAQGSGPAFDKIDDALKRANEFATGKL